MDSLDRLVNAFWLIYLVGGLVVAEIILAIASWVFQRRWTLSHHIWRWFGVHKTERPPSWWVRWVALAGLGVSILLHFVAFFSALWIVVFAIPAAWSVWYHHKKELRRWR